VTARIGRSFGTFLPQLKRSVGRVTLARNPGSGAARRAIAQVTDRLDR
jgi:hypothetical protein